MNEDQKIEYIKNYWDIQTIGNNEHTNELFKGIYSIRKCNKNDISSKSAKYVK